LPTLALPLMIRREARLRRDYLHRKSLAQQQQTTTERKSFLREALTSGKRIKTDLKYQGTELIKDLLFDEHELIQGEGISQDDEYSNAGFQDPKVVITTSRDPSSKLSQFSKEVRLLFPNSQRINRGNHVIKDIVASCKKNSITDLIILYEHRGVPDGMIISHFPHGPTAFFSLHNVALRHDLPEDSATASSTISEAYPHLVMNNFVTKLGERTRNILKHLFPVPKEDSKRIMTFSNLDDFISFRHHVYRRVPGGKIELAEMGPRFEMRLYQIKLGTIDIEEADTEWVLHSFMNTAKKHNYL
jgi:U3 small nucleolar ribonucleoprotein protein IMP4